MEIYSHRELGSVGSSTSCSTRLQLAHGSRHAGPVYSYKEKLKCRSRKGTEAALLHPADSKVAGVKTAVSTVKSGYADSAGEENALAASTVRGLRGLTPLLARHARPSARTRRPPRLRLSSPFPASPGNAPPPTGTGGDQRPSSRPLKPKARLVRKPRLPQAARAQG